MENLSRPFFFACAQVFSALGGDLQYVRDKVVVRDPSAKGVPLFTREAPSDVAVGVTYPSEPRRER